MKKSCVILCSFCVVLGALAVPYSPAKSSAPCMRIAVIESSATPATLGNIDSSAKS